MNSKVIVALDFAKKEQAEQFISQISPQHCRLKVGKEMFTLYGPEWIKSLVGRGFDVFLDLKFHDIPNTVAKAVEAASQLGVWMVNVHASGGPNMIAAAKEACQKAERPPLLTAVTILTSMDVAQFRPVYGHDDIERQVRSLALLAQDAGADGVVCSAKEAKLLRQEIKKDFCLVTPGIRPVGSASDDQKRIMTPVDAIHAGVDYLVIGRPITQSANPSEVLSEINASLSK